MPLTFTVLYAGRRFVRRFAPDQAVAAALALKERETLLRDRGYAVLLQGDDNVVHIVHRQHAQGA